jgi:hypothetical protein
MDGRWWLADRLQGGEQNMVVYRPMGRLRIDYSGDHARLRVPWLDARARWSGPVSFGHTLEIFGRQWHIARWEQDAEHTWLNLVFAGTLPAAEIAPNAETLLHRSRPASVDMGWAALENALAASFTQNTRDPIEQLRRDELIPLGRAIFALAESAMSRLRKPEMIESRLRAICYMGAELRPSYGRVPWRILPELVRKTLLDNCLYGGLVTLSRQAFDGLPEMSADPLRNGPGSSRFLGRVWQLWQRLV